MEVYTVDGQDVVLEAWDNNFEVLWLFQFFFEAAWVADAVVVARFWKSTLCCPWGRILALFLPSLVN